MPHIINLVDRIFMVEKSDVALLNFSGDRDVALNKPTYTYQDKKADLALGFQKSFWSREDGSKYWGVTTVEHWGDNDQKPKLNVAKLNYTNLAPTLAKGNSALTISGGGNSNLANETDTSNEFEEFRGGVTYHHGVVDDLTMGVGFVYEDYLIGFTQLTYQSDPLRTTVSILANDTGVDFRSHIRLQPVDSFVLNYYHDNEKDKFDANWKLASGLTLLARGNSKNDSLSTGVQLAVRNQFMSVSANAALDNNNNLQWNLDSRIGNFRIVHGNNQYKSTSELNLDLLESNAMGFRCTTFVQYESKLEKADEEFIVWGSKLQSGEKITPNQHRWTVDLGYGSGKHGNGLIASGSVALKSNLFFKLTYQDISADSDDTKIKLQLSSK